MRNPDTLGKQTGVVTTHRSSNGKTFALEVLGAAWRMPRKTGHEYRDLEARKKEKKWCPVGERPLLPHRLDGEGWFCGRGSHGDLHYRSSLHGSRRLSETIRGNSLNLLCLSVFHLQEGDNTSFLQSLWFFFCLDGKFFRAGTVSLCL